MTKKYCIKEAYGQIRWGGAGRELKKTNFILFSIVGGFNKESCNNCAGEILGALNSLSALKKF